MHSQEGFPQLPRGMYRETRGREHLLVHPDLPRWVVVNDSGLMVAALCDGKHTIWDIARAVAQHWGQKVDAVQPGVEACLETLRHAGFLSPSFVPMSDEGEVGSWRLHIYLTERCNLHCIHCGTTNRSPGWAELSFTALRQLVDQAVAAGAIAIAFSGGEPLLYSNLYYLLDYSADRVTTLLATNATLVDARAASRLSASGVRVQISMDGSCPASHDWVRGARSFESAWQGIVALQESGMNERITLNVTLMQHNIQKIDEMITLAQVKGVPEVRFNLLQRIGRAAEQWDNLSPTLAERAKAYRYLFAHRHENGFVISPGLFGLELAPPERDMWCGIGRQLLVDARGDIYPCGLLTAHEFCLGNIAQLSLLSALKSEKLQRLRDQCKKRKDAIAECRTCPWRHFCQGGCEANIWLEHGIWQATDGLCNIRRELFSELIFERAKAKQTCQKAKEIHDHLRDVT